MRECKAFVEKNDIQIIGTYIDRALSAKTDNRPDFQRMIKESSSGMFNIVIVWKLDRFARNRYDSAHCKSIFRKNGVKVVSATELISDSAEGVLLESMLEGMAEYYSAELSEKVVRGLTENALKCKYNGDTFQSVIRLALISIFRLIQSQHLLFSMLLSIMQMVPLCVRSRMK